MERIQEARLITAIKTPYLENGKIDYSAFDSMVERQITHRVDGLIIGGTTGEGHLMDWEEHLVLIAHSVNRFGSKLIIIGNTGSNNTKEARKATEEGFAAGMHLSLQINPYYGRTSTKGLLAHFEAVLPLGPAMIYNVPGRTGQDIQPDVVRQLAKHENFVGMKECSGNERIKAYHDEGIRCWSGNDDQCYLARHEAGAQGVVSVTSNVAPNAMRALMDKRNKDGDTKLTPLFDWLFQEPNPIPLNCLLAMMGLAKPVFRLPYAPLDDQALEKGYELLLSQSLDDTDFQPKRLKASDFILI